jgi:beta-lactam-binding protein with PASTA domain/tRNA A-37 threonylcarbamoyl transferase component Bud32
MATPRIADSVGRVLGDRYRLLRPLGTGASAHVYVAEDVSLRRRVAIKVLHPALAGDEAFLRRFRAEAQVVAALRHPNILRVYDWGDDGGAPYLVMELLEGGNLRSLLDRGHLLSPAQAAAVGADAAKALDYAHRRGLVHRDIKPANLIFDDEGRLTVADFGLARALAEATWTEPAGAVVGTARYAAPEQARGESLDSRADVYSLALVLIEATTGRVPFAADTTIGTLMGRLGRDVEAPEELGPLGPALAAAGTADPGRRLDAAGLARNLDTVAAKLPPPAPLPLAAPLITGATEADDAPTEYPGRTKLFDVAALEDDQPRRPAAASPAAIGLSPGQLGPDRGDEAEPVGGRRGSGRGRRIRIAALLLVLLLVIGGAAAGALVATGALTPTHPVPELVNQSEQAAGAALARLHFKLVVYGRSYSSFPAGTVLAQRPARGRLKEGATVSVLLSQGPQPVAVPTNLAGLHQADAAAVLQALGLKVGRVTNATSMTVLAGDVISSNPSSGTLLPGQSVDLVVSTGKPTVAVPAITGPSAASLSAAQSALQAVGLTAVENDQFSDTVPKGQVIGTQPPGGTTLTVGSQVTVVVSKGPDLVAVPQVQGDSVPQATQILNSAGFAVTVTNASSNATVKGTNPAAGTMVPRGSNVTLITG